MSDGVGSCTTAFYSLCGRRRFSRCGGMRTMVAAGADKVWLELCGGGRPFFDRGCCGGVRQPGGRVRDRRQARGRSGRSRGRPLGGVRCRRKKGHGYRCRVVGAGVRAAGRRRDSSYIHGRDGTKDGFDIALTRAVSRDLFRIASGAWGLWSILPKASSTARPMPCLLRACFDFGTYTVKQVKEYMAAQGIPVRLDF